MRKFTRTSCPTILTELIKSKTVPRWVDYGNRYKTRREANPGYIFQWPTCKGVTLNRILLPDLLSQTDSHCSYCDSYPLLKGSVTIDHYLPKSDLKYYSIVCQWENLYVACKHCQDSKAEQSDELVIRPDESAYSFQHYFTYDYRLHTIDINPQAPLFDQVRADKTIHFFDFNHPAMRISRRHAYERFMGMQEREINDFDFRFMFE